jgi:hypothetical protein
MATAYDMAPFSTTDFTGTSSEIMVGLDYIKADYVGTDSTSLVVTASDPNKWIFEADFGFGITNTTYGTSNETASEYYFTITNETYNSVEV